MIHVTQGHENGVGLEIFIKSLLCLQKSAQKDFVLYCFKQDLIKNLSLLGMKYEIDNNLLSIGRLNLSCFFLTEENLPHSTVSLVEAIKKTNHDDILLTLPTSKDQLIYNGQLVNGHTEYFRRNFKDSNITMNFLAPNQNILLLSDHISIVDVPIQLTSEAIISRVETTLKAMEGIREIEDIYFSGIDPHCGESGQISSYDSVYDGVIKVLKIKFPNVNFQGPFPADTLHLKYQKCENQLFVYAYHDQGLNPFKLKNGLIGINLTLGLPFKRVSVDHGTAFNLFGKNTANYQGMLYLLQELKNLS